ncbi:hypothetical protein CANARDRAFT_177166 [[Candida] arabinofermentans NRRL YB-2248]|uniref:non-specific serine/threonine protein kinase n=1 Tax=[Candida] arabinofermentans NRRL YB-2248 TaxID=983967 RepID=A0A1E4SWX0_9ASCO|nr:hypothetical protein CANARDRAFT_177166 [[Candida] arabinofermentans NRRL YB-2248]
MAFIGGIFNRSQKGENSIDDISKDVESLRFAPPTTPVKKTNNTSFVGDTSYASYMSTTSSPNRSFDQYPAQMMRPLERINYNKENTPPSSMNRNSFPIQFNGGTPRSSPTQSTTTNISSPTRLNHDFYAKANSSKTKRLITVCQMYFLDYYCDMFDYSISRNDRLKQVENSLQSLPIDQRAIQWKNYIGRERAYLRKRRIKPKHKDFNIITQVGQGGYGQVFLAKKKDTKEMCALKVLSKNLLTKTDETRHVLTERDILTNTRSEWLVKLYYAFQDVESVYLAMEFVPGGDFRTLLNNAGYLIPQHARFYISEMFAAVNSLHELGYTHRDLKPENFLIDSKGHIKLTDFGLAAGSVSTDRIESMKLRLNQVKDLEYKPKNRTVMERQQLYKSLRSKDIHFAHSIVGSPDYMALEVLEGKSYDYTIDYWSLGCMLFEAIVGYTPFSGSSSDETYGNLKRWRETLKRPRYEDGRYLFSDRTWQLICRLIASPNERLRSFKQIMAMPYFQEVKWETLRDRVPPFTPQLDDEEDAGYFDDFSNEADMAKYKEVLAKRANDEKMTNSYSVKADQKSFVGFTFKHKGNPMSNANNILSPMLMNNNHINHRDYNQPTTSIYHVEGLRTINKIQDSKLKFLGKCGITKFSNGIKIGYVTGDLQNISADELKKIFEGKLLDILISYQWPTLISSEEKLTLVGNVKLNSLLKFTKPRYWFATGSESGKFFERVPFKWSGEEELEIKDRVTRFISLGQQGSKEKWFYAFNLNLDPSLDHLSVNKFGDMPSLTIDTPLSLSMGSIIPQQNDKKRLDPFNKPQISTIKREKLDVNPSTCFFCLSNPKVELHMIISIGEFVYVTIAKGPLPYKNKQLGFSGHGLIVPINHYPTLRKYRQDEETNVDKVEDTNLFKERLKYQDAIVKMFTQIDQQDYDVVFWEISRNGGIHNHTQFLPIKSELSDKFEEVLQGQVEFNNNKYKSDLKYVKITDNDANEELSQVINNEDYMLITSVSTDNKQIDLQFPRRVLSFLLKLPKRLRWDNCKETILQETNQRDAFQETFKPFDFTLNDKIE